MEDVMPRLSEKQYGELIDALKVGLKNHPDSTDEERLENLSKVPGFSKTFLESALRTAKKSLEKDIWFETEILNPIIASAEKGYFGWYWFLGISLEDQVESLENEINASPSVIRAGIHQAVEGFFRELIDVKLSCRHIDKPVNFIAKDMLIDVIQPYWFTKLCQMIGETMTPEKIAELETAERKRHEDKRKSEKAYEMRAQKEEEAKLKKKKAFEDARKTKYDGHEILNHFFPDLSLYEFMSLYYACKSVAPNKIFYAIKMGMKNGLLGYREALCTLKIWPDDLIAYQTNDGGFVLQASNNDVYISKKSADDGRVVFAVIYQWLTREENTSRFEHIEENTFLCKACHEHVVVSKKYFTLAMKSDQRLLCEHCGCSGIPQKDQIAA